MKYCSDCGGDIEFRIPDGDNRERAVCTRCAMIHYSNPKNVCGCILEWQGKILLCKRAIEPRYGYWTVPAGFMENGETTHAGAAREAFEEAEAHCDDLQLFALYSLPRISQVYVMYRGTLRDGFCAPGIESLDVGLYEEDEIPWDVLAFPVVIESLQRYFEDRKNGQFNVHCADIHSRPGHKIEIVRQ
ncbi:MAG: NUDIX hydrolase [Pseudomonadota bacterium]